MFHGLRNLRRIWRIVRTLARHDALSAFEPVKAHAGIRIAIWLLGRPRIGGARSRRPGEKLSAAFQELGPAFVKLGQALSVRSDVIGEEMAADLAQLQDRLPPFPSAEARKTIEAELGCGLDEVFAEFEDEAVAAASIAQVHRAVTAQGDEVAVKVLRPGIEAAFNRDLDLIRWLAGIIARLHGTFDRLKPVEVVETFAESARIEMDLRLEAAAAQELQANFEEMDGFEVPTVDWRRTARRVLTSSWVEGVPIHDRERLEEEGHDLAEIVALMASVFFFQIFRDGFFHADLHPGTLLVDSEGRVHAVDFGIMGRVDRPTRRYLADMLYSFLVRDYNRVAEIHVSAGLVPADQSVDGFAQAARAIAEPILGLPLNQISLARLVGQLFQVTKRFRMEVQPQLLLLQKTMLVAEGVGRRLHPETNMWELARPLIEGWDGRTDGSAGARARDRGNAVGRARPPAQGARRPRTDGRRARPEPHPARPGDRRRAPLRDGGAPRCAGSVDRYRRPCGPRGGPRLDPGRRVAEGLGSFPRLRGDWLGRPSASRLFAPSRSRGCVSRADNPCRSGLTATPRVRTLRVRAQIEPSAAARGRRG